jgi:hypothetical protein
MSGDLEFAFAADLHADKALIPAFNDAAGADDALERFAFAVGGIEFGAVFEPAGVVGGDEGAFDEGFAVAMLQVFNNQFIHNGVWLMRAASVVVPMGLVVVTQIVEKGAFHGFYIGNNGFFARPGDVHQFEGFIVGVFAFGDFLFGDAGEAR